MPSPSHLSLAPLVNYLSLHSRSLPSPYLSYHGQWITLLQFILSSLDIIDQLNLFLPPSRLSKRHSLIDHIYSLQLSTGGFVAAFGLIHADIASTYSALVCLITLGDPLTRINVNQTIHWLNNLQNIDGGFRQFTDLSHHNFSDLRFVYSAICIYRLLRIDISPDQRDRIVSYIFRMQTYDGAFALHPFSEGHGGYTYCAIASLYLLDALNELPLSNRQAIIHWAVNQQEYGFSGRINKPNDACYSFWIGATLKLLDSYHLINEQTNRIFLISTQSSTMGGFGKDMNSLPDVMHTYMALTAMTLSDHDQDTNIIPNSNHTMLRKIVPHLNITLPARHFWSSIS